MNYFLRIGAYILHPLLMPLLGCIIYFTNTPRYTPNDILQSKLIAIVVLTILVPITIFFLLKNIGWIKTLELEDVSERKIPVLIHSLLILLIIKTVFNPYSFPELYYFFVGILFSSITANILIFFKLKISLHQMAIAGLTMFVIALSIHFKINMLLWIAFLVFGNGWVASSRLATKSHTALELILGFFIGLLPQLTLINYWL